MKKWNPRFVHYAREHNRTPEQMLLHDKKRFPGGSMCGFMLWINERWNEFCIKARISREFICTPEQRAFDAWLNTRSL